MKVDDIVDVFSAGKIEVMATRDAEKLRAIIAGLSADTTVLDSLILLDTFEETMQLFELIATQENAPPSTLFGNVLRNLNTATPASDILDVLL